MERNAKNREEIKTFAILRNEKNIDNIMLTH